VSWDLAKSLCCSKIFQNKAYVLRFSKTIKNKTHVLKFSKIEHVFWDFFSKFRIMREWFLLDRDSCNVLQCVAVRCGCCSVLQCDARALKRVVVCCGTLLNIAVCCSALQSVAPLDQVGCRMHTWDVCDDDDMGYIYIHILQLCCDVYVNYIYMYITECICVYQHTHTWWNM